MKRENGRVEVSETRLHPVSTGLGQTRWAGEYDDMKFKYE